VSKYIDFDTIRAAMPDELAWSEADLIRVCRQSRSPLKFIREHSRNSRALWRAQDMIAFMHRRYDKTAPEFAKEFELRLQGALLPKKKAKAS
jgi:hypothetical protein